MRVCSLVMTIIVEQISPNLWYAYPKLRDVNAPGCYGRTEFEATAKLRAKYPEIELEAIYDDRYTVTEYK